MTEAAEEVPIPQTQETPPERRFKDSWRDWALRTAIFIVFLFFASGKFKNADDAPWVVFFRQVGLGQWFRYFTGVLEIIGAFLVLFSRTVEAGLALLASVMFGAMVIVVLVLHRPFDAFFAFAFFCAIIAFWLHRRRV